ncbi:MAG TPA: diacylglycerol kinase family protein [Armatimonadota bacterium]|nr:diacylglycerol kinase family protein [Armatimonadota bacterium]
MSQPRLPGRIVLVGNPASGRGRGARAIARVRALLERQGAAVEVRPTAGPEHAIALAREAAVAQVDLVLALGGDGTVRDVAEGLGANEVPLAILPNGTGNDLARTLGIPRDLDGAVEVALRGRERSIDVWQWESTPFANVAGVGLDAAVAEAVNLRFRRLRGTLAYVTAFCFVLAHFQPFEARLSWQEGEWYGRAWLLALANARSYGGGLLIAPMAEPDDGTLDVVVVRETSKLELMRQFPRLARGSHVRHPAVRLFRGDIFRVETPGARANDRPAPMTTLDGELIAATPARVTRAPHRLRVRVPA